MHISDDQRRARLGTRHALASPVDSVVGAARSVVALHGTDPATTVLSAALRSESPIDDVLTALYDDRTLVRVLSMRRTVFAVPTDLVTSCLVAASDTVAREQRRLFHKMLIESGVTDDPEPWLVEAETLAIEAAEQVDDVTATELATTHPLLATRMVIGAGTPREGSQTVASRLMTLLSAEGRLVRARPKGGWTSTQFRWSALDRWVDVGTPPPLDDAAAELARRYVHAYGPVTEDDVVWWFGWTKTRARAAMGRLDLVEVDLDGSTGVVLADDVDPVADPGPWVALLPALDPSAMGWKHRDWLLGPHRAEVYDVNGNAGPTVWVDGRIVGGWTKPDGGPVAMELLEDVSTAARALLEEKARAVDALVGDVDLKARARGWTPVEQRLRV